VLFLERRQSRTELANLRTVPSQQHTASPRAHLSFRITQGSSSFVADDSQLLIEW
jgi:hypothetical protein